VQIDDFSATQMGKCNRVAGGFIGKSIGILEILKSQVRIRPNG
jgi:hypothetical protein